MSRPLPTSIALVALTALAMSSSFGCGEGPNASGPGATPPSSATPARVIPKESENEIRQHSHESSEKNEAEEDEKADDLEKEALKSLRICLGKEQYAPSQPAPERASVIVKALRAAPKLKPRIEPIANADGRVVSNDFVTLTEAGGLRVAALSRKAVEHTATPAEIREIQSYTRYSMKMMDLGMQVGGVSRATFSANVHVQMDGMRTMTIVSSTVRLWRMYGMQLDADDYAQIQRRLARARRLEAIAAATMGMLAAFEAVINDGGDPKALDVIAEQSLKAFPIKAAVSEADAKGYVANLKGNVAKEKARYEAWLRKAYGDAKYERVHKAQVDASFKLAEEAQDQESIVDMARKRDVGATAPVPAAAPANEGKGDEKNGGGPAGSSDAAGKAQQGLAAAQSAASGDAAGALDGTAKLFPADGTMRNSLEGVAALSRGDARGAINAAIGLVPGGGLVKDGLSLAAKLLFGSGTKG